MRHSRGFTLIEMLVVVLIIVILIAITLAVGSQVQASSQMSLTKSELTGLQGALQWYVNKTGGQYPLDMLSFLEGYQRLHSYQITSGVNKGTWAQRKNFLTSLPPSQVVTWQIPAPGWTGTANGGAGGPYMSGVIEVLDAWGYPIQYCPPENMYVLYMLGNPQSNPPILGHRQYTSPESPFPLLFPYPQMLGVTSSMTINGTGTGDGYATTSVWEPAGFVPYGGVSTPTPYTYGLPLGGQFTGSSIPPPFVLPPGANGFYNWHPPAPSYDPPTPGFHAPCFYSYGPNTTSTYWSKLNPVTYIYSNNP